MMATVICLGVSRMHGNGGTVKVLMIHPLSDVCKYAMMQDFVVRVISTLYRDIVGRNLQTFSRMRTKCKGGEKLLVRTLITRLLSAWTL